MATYRIGILLRLCPAVALLSFLPQLRAAEIHQWTSANGKHTKEAEFVRVDGKKVVLRSFHVEIAIPLNKLDKASQKLAARLARPKKEKKWNIVLDMKRGKETRIGTESLVVQNLKILGSHPNGGIVVQIEGTKKGVVRPTWCLVYVNGGKPDPIAWQFDKSPDDDGLLDAVEFTQLNAAGQVLLVFKVRDARNPIGPQTRLCAWNGNHLRFVAAAGGAASWDGGPVALLDDGRVVTSTVGASVKLDRKGSEKGLLVYEYAADADTYRPTVLPDSGAQGFSSFATDGTFVLTHIGKERADVFPPPTTARPALPNSSDTIPQRDVRSSRGRDLRSSPPTDAARPTRSRARLGPENTPPATSSFGQQPNAGGQQPNAGGRPKALFLLIGEDQKTVELAVDGSYFQSPTIRSGNGSGKFVVFSSGALFLVDATSKKISEVAKRGELKGVGGFLRSIDDACVAESGVYAAAMIAPEKDPNSQLWTVLRWAGKGVEEIVPRLEFQSNPRNCITCRGDEVVILSPMVTNGRVINNELFGWSKGRLRTIFNGGTFSGFKMPRLVIQPHEPGGLRYFQLHDDAPGSNANGRLVIADLLRPGSKLTE